MLLPKPSRCTQKDTKMTESICTALAMFYCAEYQFNQTRFGILNASHDDQHTELSVSDLPHQDFFKSQMDPAE